MKYTPAKGLVQQTGEGSPNMFHTLAPSDTATVAVAGAALAIPVTHAVVNKTTNKLYDKLHHSNNILYISILNIS